MVYFTPRFEAILSAIQSGINGFFCNKGLGIKKRPPSKNFIKSENFNIWQNYFIEVVFRQFKVFL